MINLKYFSLSICILAISSIQLTAVTEDVKNTYFETYGWGVGRQSGINQLKVTPEEFQLFVKGLKAASMGNPPPHDPQSMQQEMSNYFRSRAGVDKPKGAASASQGTPSNNPQNATPNPTIEKNKEAGKLFIQKLLKENSNIKKTASGLYYEIKESGSEKKPSPTDKVTVHYEGKLIDGTVFDSSFKRNKPISFGLNRVIRGWTEGLQLIGEGGKVTLYIPSNLAYGDRDSSRIPGGSMLIFKVELISYTKGESLRAVSQPKPKKKPITVVTEPLSITSE